MGEQEASDGARQGTGQAPGSIRPVPAQSQQRSLDTVALIAVALSAFILLFQTPEKAANLESIPDASQYAVVANRFAHGRGFDFPLGGSVYPLQFAPGFPALILAPTYFLFPGSLGNGIFPITLFAVAAVLAAYRLGSRLSGLYGGVLASLCLVSGFSFRHWSSTLMADIPVLALALWLASDFVRRVCDNTQGSLVLDGLAVALAMSMRPLYGIAVLPFLLLAAWRSRRQPLEAVRPFLELGLPAIVTLLVIAVYQASFFGAWNRTGYHYWLPVPFDYPELTISAGFVKFNIMLLRELGIENVAVPALAATLFLAYRAVGSDTGLTLAGDPGALWPILGFAITTAGVISLIHLHFWFGELRYFLLAIAFAHILIGAGLGVVVSLLDRRGRGQTPLLVGLVLLAVVFRWGAVSDHVSHRKEGVDLMARLTPADALIVSDQDPLYLETFVAGKGERRILPLSRLAPYACVMVAKVRVPHPDPFPLGARDWRCPGVLKGGARDVFPAVAEEHPEIVVNWLKAGHPAFLDRSSHPPDSSALRAIGSIATRTPVTGAPWLERLSLKPN